MRSVHRGDLSATVALVDARHTGIDRERHDVEAAVRSLRLLSEGLATVSPPGDALGKRGSLRVGDAARLAGVRPSSVRFWEREGLLHPRRDQRSGYRLYDGDDLGRLRIIIVLRDAGYRFDDMRQVLDELGSGNPAAALVRAERRAEDLEHASLACMEATAALWGYLARYVIAGESPDPSHLP